VPRVLCPTSPALLGMAAACRSVCRAAGQRSLSMECAYLCVRGGAGKLLGSPCRCMQKCTAGWHAAPGTALGPRPLAPAPGLGALPAFGDGICSRVCYGEHKNHRTIKVRKKKPLRSQSPALPCPLPTPPVPHLHGSSGAPPPPQPAVPQGSVAVPRWLGSVRH